MAGRETFTPTMSPSVEFPKFHRGNLFICRLPPIDTFCSSVDSFLRSKYVWSIGHDTLHPMKNVNCQYYIKCPRSRIHANKAFSSTRHVTPFGTHFAHISNADHVHQFDLFIWIGFLHLLTKQRDCQILINATQLLLLCALELLFSTPGDTSRCAHHMPNPRETRSKHIPRHALHCSESQTRRRKPMLPRTLNIAAWCPHLTTWSGFCLLIKWRNFSCRYETYS